VRTVSRLRHPWACSASSHASSGAIVLSFLGAFDDIIFFSSSRPTPSFCSFTFAAESTDAVSLALHTSDVASSDLASGCSLLRLTSSSGGLGGRGTGVSESTTSLTSYTRWEQQTTKDGSSTRARRASVIIVV
jgi:hypothetical protein